MKGIDLADNQVIAPSVDLVHVHPLDLEAANNDVSTS